MKEKRITKIKEAQQSAKSFARHNHWKNIPNVDKIDHLHEELVEISQYLRYKSEKERIKFVKENKKIFVNEFGDLFFGICRLANQLGVDMEKAINLANEKIFNKYNHKKPENNIIKKEPNNLKKNKLTKL
jgi:NTP pyrophosphatase (non-canonical NTP hydrolase)